MPSDVKGQPAEAKKEILPEPPGAKMLVRLFLIPLVIAGLVVGIMVPIAWMAGGPSGMDQAIADLKKPGGERTADMLVGPGAKQRYMAAKVISDKMKEMMGRGMTVEERIRLSDQLIDVLEHHTQATEGEVQHFVLLALGRAWSVDPRQEAMNSAEAVASREKTLATLVKFADAAPANSSKEAVKAATSTRKAAVLAIGFLAGRPEVKQAAPVLIRKLAEDAELDVRFSAASALGPMSSAEDGAVVEALKAAMRQAQRNEPELVWAAAGSLAQMNVADAKDVILMLLDRKQLSELDYFDREQDAQNPPARKLGEEEQQRILINTMQCAVKLKVEAVQAKLREIAEQDPSVRVRAAAKELLEKK